MDSPTSSTSSSSGGSSTSSTSTGGTSDSSGDALTYGEGPYYNIRRGIELRQIDEDFSGLFLQQPVKAGTVLWKNRGDGPAEEKYRKIYGEDIQHLSPSELKFFIRYSYQNDDEFFISPLSEEEVNLDYSNYWNHSCEPNTLPIDEDHWVAIRDIDAGEQLTIDYACFDSNPFICIEQCLCGKPSCRQFVRGDDYRIRELQVKYDGHFLPYIVKRIEEERAIIAAGGIIGGAGGPTNDFSAAAVRAYHQRERVDVAAHNKRGIDALVARFAVNTTSSDSGSSPESSSPRVRISTTRRIVASSGNPIVYEKTVQDDFVLRPTAITV